MDALEKFTTPDPQDVNDTVNDTKHAFQTGPEYLGVTFVKIRRALKQVIEDFTLVRLVI